MKTKDKPKVSETLSYKPSKIETINLQGFFHNFVFTHSIWIGKERGFETHSKGKVWEESNKPELITNFLHVKSTSARNLLIN